MRRYAIHAAILALATMATGCGGGSNGGGGGGGARFRLVTLVPASLLSLQSSASAIDDTGATQGGFSHTGFINTSRALVWQNGTAATVVDMGPGEVRAIGGGVQIGFTGVEGLASARAQLWRGTEASRVSLHPAAGFTDSLAQGGTANVQVGMGHTSAGAGHALLWRGTAASVVDLHPATYTRSRAYGASDTVQVGEGVTGGVSHALLWQGSAAGVVDLHPAGYSRSVGWAVSGNEQVGQGSVSGGLTHALLWRGTAASIVDLHPAGFSQSYAFGVAGGHQAGYGVTSGGALHALAWDGTAASAVDLHPFAAAYTINGAAVTQSSAYGVDRDGNIVGEVRNAAGDAHAVMWQRL